MKWPPWKSSNPPPPKDDGPTLPDDRGPAEYFHGREEELAQFEMKLKNAARKARGAVFVIQAPPGAGKTALAYECMRRAEESGWTTAEIDAKALWDGNVYRENMGIKRGFPEFLKRRGGKWGAFLDFVGEIWEKGRGLSVMEMLKKQKKPLLLFVDEAQSLRKAHELGKEQKDELERVLKNINNMTLDTPVILLCAGLGRTRAALEALDVSRIQGDARIELRGLPREVEEAIVSDWIVKECGVKGNPKEWVDAIVKETYGWPHHLISFIRPMIVQLIADKGEMTREGLEQVLANGKVARDLYASSP